MSGIIKHLKFKSPEEMVYVPILTTEKDRVQFIERIEKKIIRPSLEYKDYIQYLKDNVGLDSCIFFQNVTNGGPNRKSHISIELHHEPFTLFDIVSTVLTKYQKEGLNINDFDIADEVMDLHYRNMVGIVPVSKTAHELVHSDNHKLFVPLNMVHGEYSKFIEEYGDYIDDAAMAKLKKKIEDTNNLTEESFNALIKEFTYLEVEGFEEAEKMEIEKDNSLYEDRIMSA